jgi:hypothetical protein
MSAPRAPHPSATTEGVRARARRRPARAAGVLPLSLVALLALVAGIVTITAPAGAAEPEVVSRVVDWVISSEACDQMPPGTTVTGQGTLQDTTTTRVDGKGYTHVVVESAAAGTAEDGDGNTYGWIYLNTVRAVNSLEQPQVFKGIMTDAFHLLGEPLHYSNGFVALLRDDRASGEVSLVPFWVSGDPIAFDPIAARCDPL